MLGFDRANDLVSRHAAAGNYDLLWDTGLIDREVEQCFPSLRYNVQPGRLLRMAVRDIQDISPACYALGNLHMKVHADTGVAFGLWPSDSSFLFYRGAAFWPLFRDPTDPARGGSGYDNYDKWAFKRSNGLAQGGCSNISGACGTFRYDSRGQFDVIQVGEIEGGVIIDFPANESFGELVNFDVVLTGCCVEFMAGMEQVIDVFYYFCVYPPGVDPTNELGP